MGGEDRVRARGVARVCGELADCEAGDRLSSVGLAAGRCGVAALAIVVMAPRVTVRAIAAQDGKSRLGLLGAGALLAVHFALFLGGLAHTSLPAAVALVSLEPLAVVLGGWLAFGLRPSKREAIGIALATAGAFVVTRGAGRGSIGSLGTRWSWRRR